MTSAPRVIQLDPNQFRAADLDAAAAWLAEQGVAAGPTQTFYGLMAGADRPAALDRIAAMKGRPTDKPLLLLLDDVERAEEYAAVIGPEARRLMDLFWPGPLTLLLEARTGLDPLLVGPTGAVGLRLDGSALTRALVRGAGRAVTATSANPAGRPPAETADQAIGYFGQALDLVIDAGPCPGGRPSTVVDASARPVRLVREGAIGWDRIAAAAGIQP
jgi:L-threonylcarbamoyladenylate synthase